MGKLKAVIILGVVWVVLLGIIHARTPFWVTQGGPWSIGVGHSSEFPMQFPQSNDQIISIADLQAQVPNAQFVADPFFSWEGDTLYVFFELKIKEEPNVKIGVFTSTDGLRFQYQGIALEEPFHLSYPQVFRHQNQWYLLPEAAQSNQVLLYEAIDFPMQWRVCDTLVVNRSLKDPTLYLSDTLNVLVASDNDLNLHVFTTDSLRGQWTDQRILRRGSESRPGGRMFVRNQSVYLPLQNVQKGYGSGLSLLRLTKTKEQLQLVKEQHLWLHAQTNLAAFSNGMHHLDVQKTTKGWQYVYDGNTTTTLPPKNQWKFSLKATYKDVMNLWNP